MMAFALLESLVVTGLLILLSGVLPSTWLKDGFAIKGFVILVIATATSMLFQNSLEDDYSSALVLAAYWLFPLILIVILIRMLPGMPKVGNILNNIQERVLIMSFIYVPLGLFALMVVLYKNLL